MRIVTAKGEIGRADRRRPGRRCTRPGRAARCGAVARIPDRQHRLLELLGATPGRQRDERRARRALGRSRAACGCARDLPRAAGRTTATSTTARGSRSVPTACCTSRWASARTSRCARRRSSSTVTWERSCASRPMARCRRDNPFVGQAGALAGDLVARSSQHPGGGVRSAGAALGGRARHARRRRAQPHRARQELRLAGGRVRRSSTRGSPSRAR